MGTNNYHMKVEQVTTNDSDEPRTMSSFSSSFDKTDAMLLEFTEDLDNPAGGSSSVDDNSGTAQPYMTPTRRRRVQSRLLELERYVHANRRIPMSIALGVERPISPHAIRFSQVINMYVQKKFPIRCLKWAEG
ncbi:CACTA en-spm transposon protein [Cucumis melo var. makuwa]|uniref:CACTA en-spm transposon protein n=1 Tax=Cucumis melo var. makuwa TaxID=1194695 RepID=A0A5A7SWJ2_CUCMM|nr:CACTA en-spm transposon protein [Cucumis melo var. makuwa]TYK02320.1 CACTA en-spm transposon protein [Cucumis melo var. makuwa]